jgi:hypothetical protein
MIQRKLLSNDTIKRYILLRCFYLINSSVKTENFVSFRTFQECVFHITDVYENVKNTFIQLLAAVPVDLALR